MSTKTEQNRLLSIDALHGFDLLLISGGGAFLILLEGKTGIGLIDLITNQLHHVH